MLSKKWLINICLAGLAVFIGVKANDIWSREVVIPPDTTAEAAPVAAGAVVVAAKDEIAPASYDLLVERNLFAPAREEIIYVAPEPKKKPPPKKKPEVNKAQKKAIGRIALLGVVLSEDRRTALIKGVKNKNRRAGGIRWVVEGDEIEGMQVAEIYDEKIRLTSGEADMELLLYDPERPKKRTGVKKAAKPTVLSTGGGKSSPKASKKKASPKKKTKIRPRKTLSNPATRKTLTRKPSLEQPQSPRSKRVKSDLYEKTPS